MQLKIGCELIENWLNVDGNWKLHNRGVENWLDIGLTLNDQLNDYLTLNHRGVENGLNIALTQNKQLKMQDVD